MIDVMLDEFESEPGAATRLAEDSPVRVVDPTTGNTVLTICIPKNVELNEDD